MPTWAPDRKRTVRDKRASYASDNRRAAVLILERPADFGGPEALAVRWARRVLELVPGGRGGSDL